MDYFESNMSSLKQNRFELYEKIVEYSKEHLSESTILIESAQALYGDKYLLVQKDNALHRLNSSYSPSNEAVKWVEQFSFTNMNIVISLFGLGSGLFARELINHKSKEDILIIYEPSIDIFIHVLKNHDITDIIDNDSLVLTIKGINEFEFHQILRKIVNITNLYSQIKCTHPGYEDLYTEEAIYFWQKIKDIYIYGRTNINTERVFGRRYIENELFNSRYLKDSCKLADIKEDINTKIPAIIVAAGPSLKDNIEELKRAKGKAYVFVVDRALDYVLDQGIEPDFIVTVDPIKPLKYFTTRADVNIPLLCEMDSNWEVLNQHKGRKIIYCCSPYFQKMYLSQKKKPPILYTGASVATCAFSICIQLGFKRIALVGQDMAYDGDLTHAGGIAEKLSQDRDVYVDGIGGEKVRSRSDWYEFLGWFQDMIILCSDVEVIDTKAKGAKIKGSTLMSLKKVINKYCKENAIVYNTFKEKKSTFDENEMEGVREYFSSTYDEFDKLEKKSKDALRICQEQIRHFSKSKHDNQITDKNYRKLSKINKYIIEQQAYLLLEGFITSETTQQISEMYIFTNDEQRDKILTYEKSVKIFQAIIDGVEFVKEVFKENIDYI